ncbi:MAG: ornithine cyclodeaminase family protein [Alphaproteobacteria bacterium]
MSDPVWLTERDVVDLMSLPQAIDALKAGLRLQASGGALPMSKTHVAWDGHTLHALGAAVPGAGIVGTKTWAHTAGGATPLLVLWDAETGALAAVIEAFALGQMRTGSMSGLATHIMAAPQADTMAIIGTGKQAITQVAAVAAVRPLKTVRVFSPTRKNREAFAERLQQADLPLEIEVADSLAAATFGASIITLATRAKEPFLEARMISPGAHINAIGAITPEREEVHQDVFARCSVLAADDVAATRRLSREFSTYFGDDNAAWQAVTPISGLVDGWQRPADAKLTLFKAMGMGISDLALGIDLHKKAKTEGRGRPIPLPERAPVRLTA